MKYLFALGNTPALSLAELTSVYPFLVIELLNNHWALASCEDNQAFDPQEAMQILGGTVKLAQVLTTYTVNDDEQVIKTAIIEQFKTLANDKKLLFNFSQTSPVIDLDLSEIKQTLKEAQISSRYLEAKQDGVGAAIWQHQSNFVELLLVKAEEQLYLAQTLAMQDIDDWSKRDRSKPYYDRKKGMLPPKVARMMVNLALANQEFTHKPRLFDPFCGSGTILMEAALRGCVVYGADLDYQAVLGSIKNLDWLTQEYKLKKAYEFIRRDVTALKASDFADKIDLVVTEPFLGKQTPSPAEIKNIFKGLEKLYLGAFKSLKQVLAPQAKVVIIFPRTEISGKIYNLSNLIDKLASKGYTCQVSPIVYAREGATIQREIYIFEYKG